jgi:hypothetical protein
MTERKPKLPGYVRQNMTFPLLATQWQPHEAPTYRVLSVLTDDGPISLVLDKAGAQKFAAEIARMAAEMPERTDLS